MKHPSVLRFINNSKESLAVNYGLCRVKFSLNIYDDLHIGVLFLVNQDFINAELWFSLIEIRDPNCKQVRLAENIFKNFPKDKEFLKISFFNNFSENTEFRKDYYFISPFIVGEFLRNAEINNFFRILSFLNPSTIEFKASSDFVFDWLQSCQEPNKLKSFIEIAVKSYLSISQNFISKAVIKYISISTIVSSQTIIEMLSKPKDISTSFVFKIFRAFISRGQFEDANDFIHKGLKENDKNYLKAIVYKEKGCWKKSASCIKNYLGFKDYAISDELLSLVSRSVTIAFGPQAAISTLQEIQLSDRENLKPNLYIAQLKATYYSYEEALNLLSSKVESDQTYLVNYLTIKAKMVYNSNEFTDLCSEWENSIKNYPDNKMLVSNYIEFINNHYYKYDIKNIVDRFINLNEYGIDNIKKSIIEYCIKSNLYHSQIQKFLLEYLKIRNESFMSIIWASKQLLKLGLHDEVKSIMEQLNFPTICKSYVIKELQDFYVTLGIVQYKEEKFNEYWKKSNDREKLKKSVSLIFEGKKEDGLKLFESCLKEEYDDADIKVSEYLIEISKNNYLTIKDNLLTLISQGLSPEPFIRSIYKIYELYDHDALLSALNKFLSHTPNHILAKCFKAKCLISLNRNEEAIKCISRLSYQEHYLVKDLKQWSEAITGNVINAKRIYQHFFSHSYKPWEHASIHDLKRIDSNPLPSKNEIVLFCVIKNEELRIESFLKHHLTIGVERIVVVDNGSTDKTIELLLKYKNLNIFSIPDNYVAASYGMRWINHLADQIANDNWRIVADADEFLIYPYCEKVKLRKLIEYLDEYGYEVVRGFMLDMIPDNFNNLNNYKPGDDPVSCSGYFDDSHRKIMISDSPYESVVGGSRHRLIFGSSEFNRQPLCKATMIKGGQGIHHQLANHYTTPAKVADLSTAFLHFKFLVDWQKRGVELMNGVVSGPYAGILKQYADFSKNHEQESLLCNKSHKYIDSDQLIEMGIITPGQFNI